MTTTTLIIFAIVIIVTALCILFIILTPASNSDDKLPVNPLEKVKLLLIDRKVEEKYISLANDYSKNIATAFEDKFMDNIKKRPKTVDLSDFGIKLLSKYQLDNTKTEYVTIVEDLIRKMEGKLEGLGNMDSIPWKDNWWYLSITYSRLLAMYEYIGNDEEVKKICHNRIKILTPQLNKSLGKIRSGYHIVLIGIPRLLTDKLNDPPQYERDIQLPEFNKLQEEFNKDFNTDNSVKVGIYQDYSCINNSKVPTFSATLSLGGFYVDVYTWLGFKSTLVDAANKILDKTIHPNLDFIPYGLFGRDPRITCEEVLEDHWRNYKRNKKFDVNLFPFIGLGVFKSEKFVFSLRVQRDGIAAYESNKSYQQFALGWIQMRKLYLEGTDYSSYNRKMEWKDLKIQPGVISFTDDDNNKFDKFRTTDGTSVVSRFCEDVKSYIGHLENHKNRKLLYWFNKYKFKAFYGDNVIISEIGVCTDNGIVMRFEINNNSGKELKLILKDKDIGNKMYFKPSVDDSGAGIRIPSGGESVIVNWYQVFDKTIEPKTVDWKQENNSMSFTINGDKYSIEQHNKYHIVKCDDEIVLAGNSSSLCEESITHHDALNNKDIYFKRDSKTLMYIPQKS